LTASNNVPDTQAGDGSGSITGYDVTSVSYTLNGGDPSIIDAVDFNLNTAPATGSEIQIRLEQPTGDWYSCTFAAFAVSCDTSGGTITVLDANELRVVAAD
jgi:hypothetical protein